MTKPVGHTIARSVHFVRMQLGAHRLRGGMQHRDRRAVGEVLLWTESRKLLDFGGSLILFNAPFIGISVDWL